MNWKTSCGKALTIAERSFLKNIAAAAAKYWPKLVIVNIGVFRYASEYCLRAGAPNARIVGIDIERPSARVDPGLKAELIIADSQKCYQAFKAQIHVLFIDGDHRYAGVAADLKNWTPKVAPGGVVILHDCHPLPRALKVHPEIEGPNRAASDWFAKVTDWKELKAADSMRAFRRNL